MFKQENYFITTLKQTIDYKNKLAYMKVYNIQHNSRLDKTYFKSPRFKTSNNRIIKCPYIALKKPNSKIIKSYEQVKDEYTQEINRSALEELTKPKEKNKTIDYDYIINEVKKNHKQFLKKRGKRKFISPDKISNDFNISRMSAYKIKQKIEEYLKI